MCRLTFLVAFVFIFSQSLIAADTIIWVEAEVADKKQLVDNPGLNDVNPSELSGGQWICSFAHDPQPVGTAEYALDVPQAGNYRLWVRAIAGTGLAYRLDDAKEPVPVAVDKDRKDVVPIAATGVWHYPPAIAWYDLGSLELTAGKHTLTWYLGSPKGKDRWGGMDCFLLTTDTFTPHGKYKPDEKAPEPISAFQPGQTWDFQPGADQFDPAAILDLRSLNEKTAGEHGFIKLSPDGNSFLRGDGVPIRFWAVGERTTYKLGEKPEALERQARFLAKRGVNALRIFLMIPPTGKDSKLHEVNEKELDMLFRLVAAMKEAGIYVVIDAYWATTTIIQPNWDISGQAGGKPNGLVFFDPKLQEGYKAWMKEIYTRPNPYTKLKLADDPAVAVIQLQNEDSLLWWDFANIKGQANLMLRTRFAEFLKEKYGALDKARAAWKDYKAEFPADEWDKGLPGFLHIWDLTRDAMAQKIALPGFQARSADQLEFIAKLMRKFNADMSDYLRKDLGCKQLINANNWHTVDMVLTQDAEYWAQCANDVIARNCYTGGVHSGVNNGWQILPNHVYSDLCLIKDPLQLPTNVKQPQGHPFIIPEILWTPPNLYQSEAALMVAAQKSLTGLGMTCWFSNWAEEWGQHPVTKWTYSTPMQIGQFPAAALLYRQGYLKLGEPAVVEQRSLQQVWDRKPPMIAEDPGWDPNRNQDNAVLKAAVKTAVDPLAYLVGPVRVVYGGDPAKSTAVDLAKYIDHDKKTVRSITGEIETNYGQGLYRVNAPKAQAVAGFLGEAGPQKLSDVEIACKNKYATVVVVSMDDKPLEESGQVLVQVGTLARPAGWTVRPYQVRDQKSTWVDGFIILATGKVPWQVEKTDATLTIANGTLTQATVLDANGMPTKAVIEVRQAGGQATLTLPPDALYVVLTAGAPATASQAAQP